jgi:hypothetical protein
MYRFAVDYCVHVLCLLVWQVIDAHFEARPLLVAGRLATVAAAATRVAAAWAWEEKFGPGAEKRGDVLRREVFTTGVFFLFIKPQSRWPLRLFFLPPSVRLTGFEPRRGVREGGPNARHARRLGRG